MVFTRRQASGSTPATNFQSTKRKNGDVDRPRKKTSQNQVSDQDLQNSPDKKSVVAKTWKPRKKLMMTQVYSLNQTNTKQIFVGLDSENSFQPTIYLSKFTAPKTSGVYLNQETFMAFLSTENAEIINQYFSSYDENFKPEPLEINRSINIQFKKFYNQKSIIISDAADYVNIHTDLLILQASTWDTLYTLSDCIIQTTKVLEHYVEYCRVAYNHIFKVIHNLCQQLFDVNDIGNLENNLKSIYFNVETEPTDEELLNLIHEHITLAKKIYLEVKIGCAESIINENLYAFKYFAVSGSDTQSL